MQSADAPLLKPDDGHLEFCCIAVTLSFLKTTTTRDLPLPIGEGAYSYALTRLLATHPRLAKLDGAQGKHK